MTLSDGDAIERTVMPDAYTTVRYAGASGDFNPIHIDDAFARSVGLPGRILHGLWTMAQVAHTATDAAGGVARADGGGYTLRSLSVTFRGMAVPEQEIAIRGTASAAAHGAHELTLDVRQGDTRLIRRASARLDPT